MRAAVLILVLGAASCVSESTQPPRQEAPPPTTPEAPVLGEGPPYALRPEEASPAEIPASPDQLSAPEGLPGAGLVHGNLAVRYRGRFTDDTRDQDVRGVLALDVADPSAPWIKGYLLARTDIDIDGLDEDAIFEDLTNTYDGAVVSKVFLAYADLALDRRPDDSASLVRIGRQSDPRLPEVLRLDGVSWTTRPMKEKEVEFGLYGGIPAHLYESSSESEDLAFGTFVEGRPWTSGWARMDWMHIEDELVLGEERNDLLSFELWQEMSQRWRLESEFSHLEGDPRDLRLRSLWNEPESESLVRASYYELLETQTQRVTELDPFYDQLLAYEPFRQGTVSASRAFGDTLVDVGIDVRRVSHSADVGEFNREWERYYVTTTLRDLGKAGLALSVTADFWDGDEQDTNSLGADLSYRVDARWEASLGTYYSLYKYELLELSEQDDVRTYYVRWKREMAANLDFDVHYELEDDDLDIYHTVRMGLLWRF